MVVDNSSWLGGSLNGINGVAGAEGTPERILMNN